MINTITTLSVIISCCSIFRLRCCGFVFVVVVLCDRSRFLGIVFKHFGFISPKTGFGFASIRLWAYLKKVIPETRRAHLIVRLRPVFCMPKDASGPGLYILERLSLLVFCNLYFHCNFNPPLLFEFSCSTVLVVNLICIRPWQHLVGARLSHTLKPGVN